MKFVTNLLKTTLNLVITFGSFVLSLYFLLPTTNDYKWYVKFGIIIVAILIACTADETARVILSRTYNENNLYDEDILAKKIVREFERREAEKKEESTSE